MAWQVKVWDQSLGRGVITSPQLGELPFDGAAATVSDFALGEVVEVSLAREGDSFRVTGIWPDDPRFAPRALPGAEPSALSPELAERLGAYIATIPVLLDYRIAGVGDDLVVEADEEQFAYGPTGELRFRDVAYVELPRYWGGKSFRLADKNERSYLGTRTELNPDSVAVRIVDDERRIYFVVCGSIGWRAIRRDGEGET